VTKDDDVTERVSGFRLVVVVLVLVVMRLGTKSLSETCVSSRLVLARQSLFTARSFGQLSTP